jgi:long-chain fatty acid transport protein
MENKFQNWVIAAVACAGGSSALAGGMEVTRLPTDMMFEKGNYASISFGRFKPDVTDDTFATQGSMYKDRSATTLTFKTQINEKLSIGFARYKSAEISLDYSTASVFFANFPPGAGGPLDDPYVDLSVNTMALLGRYEVDRGFSVIGGLKYSSGSGGGNVLVAPAGVIEAKEDSVLGGIVGVSYEKPEIALRISGIYQAKQDMSHPTTTNLGAGPIDLENTKSALPESFTIDFQSGIAPNTLLFGSIHRAFWSDAHISFWTQPNTGGLDGAGNVTNAPNGEYVQKSTWTNTTSLSLGIGRKLSDQWAVSASFNYEGSSEPTGTSLLSTTDGVRGITLGGKYTVDNTTISVGVNRSKLGDKTVTSLGSDGIFANNSITTIGFKIGQSF